MNEAGGAPPGTTPMKQPIAEERIAVIQYRGSSFQVSITTRRLIFASLPLNASPSSSVSRISPMPNSPITATRKLKPLSSQIDPKLKRSVPVTVSVPTEASRKPSIIEARVLNGGSLLMPMKAQKVSRKTEKNSGGPKASANSAMIGDTKVIITTATSAPKNEAVKEAVSACPARPCCAIG